MVNLTNVSYYGLQDVVIDQDNDFDIGDHYAMGQDVILAWFSHSHGSAHIECYGNSNWFNAFDTGGQLTPAVADRPLKVNMASAGSSGNGAVRITGSAIDNTVLTVVWYKTTKTAG